MKYLGTVKRDDLERHPKKQGKRRLNSVRTMQRSFLKRVTHEHQCRQDRGIQNRQMKYLGITRGGYYNDTGNKFRGIKKEEK